MYLVALTYQLLQKISQELAGTRQPGSQVALTSTY